MRWLDVRRSRSQIVRLTQYCDETKAEFKRLLLYCVCVSCTWPLPKYFVIVLQRYIRYNLANVYVLQRYIRYNLAIVYVTLCIFSCATTCTYVGIDFEEQRTRAPNNWESPMILSVITTLCPQYYRPQYFWQDYASDYVHVYYTYLTKDYP